MEQGKVERVELGDKDNEFQMALQNLFLVAASLLDHNKGELVIAQSKLNNKVIRVQIDTPPEDEVFTDEDV